VAHLDDGSSFSQSFTNAPVDNPDIVVGYLTEIVDQVVVRNVPAPRRNVAPEVSDLIGKKVDPIRTPKDIKEVSPVRVP
jgi:hypothetical protein